MTLGGWLRLWTERDRVKVLDRGGGKYLFVNTTVRPATVDLKVLRSVVLPPLLGEPYDKETPQ